MKSIDNDNKQQQLFLLRQQLKQRRQQKHTYTDNTQSTDQVQHQYECKQNDDIRKPPLPIQSKSQPWNGFGPSARPQSAQLTTHQISNIINKLAQQSPVSLDIALSNKPDANIAHRTIPHNNNPVSQNNDVHVKHESTTTQRIATYDSALGLDDTTDDDCENDSANLSHNSIRTNSINQSIPYIPTQRSKPQPINTTQPIVNALLIDVSPSITSPVPDTPPQPFSPTYGDTQQNLSLIQQINNTQQNTIYKSSNTGIPYRSPSTSHEQELRLFIGTWNLHAKPVPHNLIDFIQPGYDIYAIGTEECENSIESSFIFTSKQKWCNSIQSVLGDAYIEIAQQTLVAMHCIVYIRVVYAHLVSNIEVDSVATGIGDVMGNKGGVGISFSIGYTNMLFVTSHFQAHQNNITGRNNDYMKIQSKLNNGISNDNKHIIRASDRFEHCYWFGDLNYRVHANRSIANVLISRSQLEVMLANDQLIHERIKHRVFNEFIESEITFPPTYKFDANSDLYDTSKKQRIPSWTDRILYKSCDSIQCMKYDSVRNIRTSDHRPVYATFKIRVIVSKPAVQADNKLSDHTATTTCTIQ